MTGPTVAPVWEDAFVDAELQHRVERFYTYESRLLDRHDYGTWFDLLTDDVHYWMPTRRNRVPREAHLEDASPAEMAHFDDDKRTMGWRVRRLLNTMAWSEDPRSRTRHLVTNVWIAAGEAGELVVESSFLVYRNRLEHDVDTFVGERRDVLRPQDDGDFRIARRVVLLDQSVILAKNIGVIL